MPRSKGLFPAGKVQWAQDENLFDPSRKSGLGPERHPVRHLSWAHAFSEGRKRGRGPGGFFELTGSGQALLQPLRAGGHNSPYCRDGEWDPGLRRAGPGRMAVGRRNRAQCAEADGLRLRALPRKAHRADRLDWSRMEDRSPCCSRSLVSTGLSWRSTGRSSTPPTRFRLPGHGRWRKTMVRKAGGLR